MAWNILTSIVGFAFVGGIYIAVCMFLASGGWQRLHIEYPAVAKPDGQQWRFASARIGRTFYQALRVVDAEKGLYMGRPIPLVFHGAVLIPWAAVTREKETQSESHFGQVRLSVSTSRGPVMLAFHGAVAKMIEARLRLDHLPTAE